MTDTYSGAGEYWDRNPRFHEEDAEFKVEQAVALMRRRGFSPSSILDVGCGSGRSSYLFARVFGVPTVGLDVSERSLSRARQKYVADNLEFQLLPIEAYPSRAALGVMFDVFEHVEDYFGFLKSARAKADYWIFNIPLEMNVYAVARSLHKRSRVDLGHLHYFSEETALATLRDCGYEVLDQTLAPVLLHQLRVARRLGKPDLVRKLLLALPAMALLSMDRHLGARLIGCASLYVFCTSSD